MKFRQVHAGYAAYEGMAKNCIITLSEWDHLEVYRHTSSTGKNTLLAKDEYDHLEEIPVFMYEDDNVVVLEGHGVKSMAWIIYKFYNAKIDGVYGGPRLKV